MARGRPPKTLLDFVMDGTFLARRHEHLLDREAPFHRADLEEFRQRFRAARSSEEAREVALDLERMVRARRTDADALEDVLSNIR